ncbi:hypothetical protein ACQJBY_031845 [Aegilops geniculata]
MTAFCDVWIEVWLGASARDEVRNPKSDAISSKFSINFHLRFTLPCYSSIALSCSSQIASLAFRLFSGSLKKARQNNLPEQVYVKLLCIDELSSCFSLISNCSSAFYFLSIITTCYFEK